MSNRLLTRLCVVYGQPDSPDPVAYLKEIGNLISGYSVAEMETAGDSILRNHRGRSFPTPSEIAMACADARGQERESVPQHKLNPAWTNARIAVADRLIRTPMGKVAASEGWNLSLHDFIRHNGRLPEPSEIGSIKAKARGFDDAYSAVCRGDGGMLSGPLRRLGDSFLGKRDKYARMADEQSGA